MCSRHVMVIFGGIGHCPCLPVQPGITLRKTSNHSDIPWDESKLKKSSQKGRGEIRSPKRELKCHAMLGFCWRVGVTKNKILPISSCPVPIASEEEDGVRSEGKSFLSNPPCGPAASRGCRVKAFSLATKGLASIWALIAFAAMSAAVATAEYSNLNLWRES